MRVGRGPPVFAAAFLMSNLAQSSLVSRFRGDTRENNLMMLYVVITEAPLSLVFIMAS